MNHTITKITTLVEDNRLMLMTTFKLSNVDKAIQDLVLGSISVLTQDPKVRFKKLLYMTELQNDLILLCKDPGKGNINQALETHLYRVNFNTMEHFEYWKSKILQELSALYDESERYLVLCEYQRRFKAKQEFKNICYEKKFRGIRDLMLSFLNSELKCCEKILFAKGRKDTGTVRNEFPDALGVQTSVTVDVIAYLLFLMVKAGVFPEDSKSPLLRMFARYVRTPGVGPEGISLNSLQVKYRQAVQSTAKKVKALLLKMVKQVDDDFGLN